MAEDGVVPENFYNLQEWDSYTTKVHALKSTARSLRAAVRLDPECAGEIPSTKGVL